MKNIPASSVSPLAEELYLVIAQLVRRLRTEGAQHELSWSQLSAMGRNGTSCKKSLNKQSVVLTEL